jgi:phosphatidylserine/phosphatidylglycerophosphate/cardiolipin synthase-like enzyme
MGGWRVYFSLRTAFLALCLLLAVQRPAAALERFCDSSYEDCRAPLLSLIANERVGIDVAFWFMEDARYTAALIARLRAGVPVRVLVDPRANVSTPLNADRLRELAAAGVPMRKRIASGILHWKTMIFVGQGTVEFGSANYSATAFKPITPYSNYIDEMIHFTDDRPVVNSFLTAFDSLWVDTTAFANYANIKGALVRRHPKYPKDPELNLPPAEDYGARAVARYTAESTRIDAIMYRITDRRHTDALIAAAARGVPVRLIIEPDQYRDRDYIWDAWNVDRLYMAGVQIKQRRHAGVNHGKLTLLSSQGIVVYGSSNWTAASATKQVEHNHFFKDPTAFSYYKQQFLRKWNNSAGVTENVPFSPMTPGTPTYSGPANGSHQSTTLRLAWNPGSWAHKADVYFGTTPNPPLVARDVAVTPNVIANYTLPKLSTGKRYYWRIVSKTMANKTKAGSIWSFDT